MEFLADYGEDNENSSPRIIDKQSQKSEGKRKSSDDLQAEWESFEKMICGGTAAGGTGSADPSNYLQDGIVAYPSLNKPRQRTNTESSGEPNSAKKITGAEKMEFSFEEVQNISLPPEMPKVSRSRSPSVSSRSSSRSSKSRSVSASSSAHSDDSDREDDREVKKKSRLSTESKEDTANKASTVPVQNEKRRSSRSSASPTKRKRSRSRSKSKSPSRRRRSRSRSHSRRKRSRRSHGRRHRSSSRSRRHRRHRSKQRSRSRDRRRRKHRRSSRDRRSRSRSKDRRRKRRSRSRSKDRRKRAHRRTRSRSRSRGKGRHSRSRSHGHSRSRSRSRSHDRKLRTSSASSYTSHPITKEKPLTFKEQMRQQLLKASKFLQNGENAETSSTVALPQEKASNLPLNQTSILSAMAASVSSATSSGVTPQMALLQTMAAMHQKAQEMTGVTVPKYYNPAAVNPLKYAEQVQKRKLLWSKNKEKNTDKDKDKEKEWQATSFVSDSDGKMAAKFRKLMGMKEGEEVSEEDDETPKLSEEQQKKQQELFSRLDREYEFARMTTHTHRGVGLGFTSQGTYPNT